jgi:3-oxoacyl-[acyl-carrier-protein] synthase-3
LASQLAQNLLTIKLTQTHSQADSSTKRYARITGTGSFLPPKRVTNADLVTQLASTGVETSDDWIVERTGIRARHFSEQGVLTSELAVAAATNAMQAAGVQASDIDLIIVATSTPDMVFPSTACIVQNKLGMAGCAAFDIQAVCTGFVYALAQRRSPKFWTSKTAPPACCLETVQAPLS